MSVTVEQDEARCRVRLEGEINIASAAELKRVLIEALETKKQVRVELEGAKDMDVTALQLLWAPEREARKTNVGFAVVGPVPAEIAAMVAEVGLEEVGGLMAEKPPAAE